jgi:hypothetical protein
VDGRDRHRVQRTGNRFARLDTSPHHDSAMASPGITAVPSAVMHASMSAMGKGDGVLRIGLERGRTWTFASAVDWPGWCRRGTGDDAAVQTLLDHADRYAAVVALAGVPFEPGEPTVIGAVAGSGALDFGALDPPQAWDDEPLTGADLDGQRRLLTACWTAFDATVAGSAAELRKGPRGGGRDRDPIVEHVREAERSYVRSIGLRLPPGTPWPDQRDAVLDRLRSNDAATTWPPRYLVRRAAWHVLDHAWEIEDKQP